MDFVTYGQFLSVSTFSAKLNGLELTFIQCFFFRLPTNPSNLQYVPHSSTHRLPY